MHILWFRRDLRLEDNEIITQAAADNQPVLPCFIIDPWFYQQLEIGKARVRFLFESLEDLDCNLRTRGSQLYLFKREFWIRKGEGSTLRITKSFSPLAPMLSLEELLVVLKRTG